VGRLTPAEKLAGGAMIVTVIAAFLPWVSLFGISAIGIEGDGLITLVCGLVGLGVLASSKHMLGPLRFKRRPALVVSGILAGVTALVGLYDMNGAAAMGLYLTMFAGIAWVAAVIWAVREGRASSAARPPDAPEVPTPAEARRSGDEAP
jgi:hypothetical protein